MKKRLNKLDHDLSSSFKDRYGKWDGKALTAFISFIILILSWYFNMFFGFELNELMIEIFAFLIFSLLGLKVLPWGKKDAIKIEEQNNNFEEYENK
jgi:hypothetical protein